MIAALVVSAFLKLSVKTPIVSSCSAAISAACHPSRNGEGDTNDPSPHLVEQPLLWGLVGYGRLGTGHATFSDGPVTPLVPGGFYQQEKLSVLEAQLAPLDRFSVLQTFIIINGS
jgi:hypothetical protein